MNFIKIRMLKKYLVYSNKYNVEFLLMTYLNESAMKKKKKKSKTKQ